MKQDIKIHEIEYEIIVDRLSIEIKFPCRITASFRVGRNQSHSNENIGLENGVAKFTEPIAAKGMMHIIDNCLQEKKSYLTIYVMSNSGKNIAGVCTLDLALHTTDEWKVIDKQLERCPDRNARICLRIRSSFLRQVEECPSESAKSEQIKVVKGLTPRADINTQHNNSQSHRFRPVTSPFRENRTANVSMRMNHIINRDRSVHSFQNQSQQKRSDDRAHSRADDTEKNRQISSLKDDVTERQRRITRLEVQKQSYLREVEGLKGQLDSIKSQITLKSNKQIELVGENERLKRRLQASQNSIEIMKMKRAEWQKREIDRRQNLIGQKNLIEDLRAQTETVAELEKELKASKKAREELDKMIREKMRDYRELSERYDDQSTTISTLQKRIQMKQTFYKEEIKKYNERQIELESERQRLYTQINSLRDVLDEKERKSMQHYKQGQKLWIDERSKLNKKLESLKIELQQSTMNHQNTSKQLNSQSAQIDRLQKQLHQSFEQNQNMKLELERSKKQLVAQTNYRLKYEEQQKEKSTLKQQKAGLQKQLDDILIAKNIDLHEINRQLTQKSEQLKSSNERIADLMKKIRQKDQRIVQLQSNIETTSKKYQISKRSDEKKGLQIAELKNSEKIHLLDIQSLDQQRQELELLVQNIKFKQQAQIEQLRKALRKNGEECQTLRNKLRNEIDNTTAQVQTHKILNQKYHVNLKEMSILEDRLKKTEKECMDLHYKQKDYKDQIDRLTANLSESKDTIRKQGLKNQENYTKLHKLQSENIRLALAQEQLIRAQKQLKDKQQELLTRIQNESKLQISIQKQEAQLSTLKQDLRSKIVDFNRQKLASESLRKQQSILNESLDATQRELQLKAQELSELKKQLVKTSSQRKQFETKLTSITSDHKKYRQSVLQSLRLTITYLFGSRQGSQPPVSDYQVSEIQRELIRKLSKLQQQHTADLNVCKQHLQQSYKDQLKLVTQKHEQLYSQLNNQLQSKKEEFHYFREGMLVKNDELMRETDNLHTQLDSALQEFQIVCQEKDEIDGVYRKLMIENEELQTINQQLERELKNKQKDAKQLQDEITRERQQKEQIFSKVYSERETTHSKMQATQKAMVLQIQQLEGTLRQKQSQLDSANSQTRTIGKELDGKNETIKSLQKQLVTSKSVSQELESQISNLLKRERDLLDKIRLGEQNIILEQQKLSQVKSTLGIVQVKERQIQEIKLTLQREKDNFNKKVVYMEQQYKSSEQANIKVKEELSTLQQQLFKANSEIRRLTDSNKNLDEITARKSTLLSERITEITNFRQKIGKLQRQIVVKDDAVNQFKSKHESEVSILNQEKNDLLFKISQIQSNLKKVGDTKTLTSRELQRELSKVRTEKDILLQKLTQMQLELQKQVQILEKAKRSQDSLLAQIQSMRIFTEQTQNDNVRLQNTLQIRNRQFNELNKRYQSIDNQFRTIQKSTKEGNIKLSELESDFTHIKNQRDLMKNQSSDRRGLENELKSGSHRLVQAQKQLSRLGTYCQSLEQTIQKYKVDKEFMYKQLKDEVQKSNYLIRQKQQFARINEEKLNGVMHMSNDYTEERRGFLFKIAQQSEKLDKQAVQILKIQTEKSELIKRMGEDDQQNKANNYKYETQIRELVKAKTGLLNNLEQMSIQTARQKQALEKMYDKEFRDIEAKRILQLTDADERVQRAYKQKFEDQAMLKFQIQRLKSELQKGSGSNSLQSSMKSISMKVLDSNKSQFKQQMTETKLKHYLAKQPLRNLQALIPHITRLCQQRQKLVHTLQNKNKELEDKSKGNRYYISPGKMVHQDSLKPDTELLEKLREADNNLRITFSRVEEMASEMEQLTEDKLKIIGKSRELQDMLAQGNDTMNLQDKVSQILDYSRINFQQRNFPTPPQSVRSSTRRGIQRVDSDFIVVPGNVWSEHTSIRQQL